MTDTAVGDVAETENTLQQLIAGIDGTVGVAARDLVSGEELRYNADIRFPTASTMKSILLYELYRQSDAGQVDLTRRVRFTDDLRVPGSGVLQDLDAGLEPTVRDVATLMITVSDNACTDIIYDILGKEAVHQTIERLGMTSTELPITIWEMMCGLGDFAPDRSVTGYDWLRSQMKAGEAQWDCRSLAEEDNDLSTPADFIKLHEAIHNRVGISEQAQEGILNILNRQKFNTIIPLHLPKKTQVAHKTGSLKGVRNDVGIVYPPDDGHPYAVAIMSKRLEDEVAGGEALSRISKAIYDYFAG